MILLSALLAASTAIAQPGALPPDPGENAAYTMCVIRTARTLAAFDRTADAIADTAVRACDWLVDAHFEVRRLANPDHAPSARDRDFMLFVLHGVAVATVNRERRHPQG